jgi:two-component system sensor histidine kinase UhpB
MEWQSVLVGWQRIAGRKFQDGPDRWYAKYGRGAVTDRISSTLVLKTREDHNAGRDLFLQSVGRSVSVASVVAAAYGVGIVAGHSLKPGMFPIATYWPPNAILMASLLLMNPRRWWTVLPGVALVHLLVQTYAGVPLITSLGWFTTNTSEALLGASLLYSFNKPRAFFYSIRGTLAFLALAVILAPVLTSFLDASVVVLTQWGHGFWMLWTTRLFSNMLAVLTLVPAIVALGIAVRRQIKIRRVIEAGAIIILLLAATLFVYGTANPIPDFYPVLVYVPLPLLLWTSLRFGAGALSSAVALIAFISFHYVGKGVGPFTSSSMIEDVVFLQILLIVVTVPLLLLSAVLSERQRTETLLRESRSQIVDTQERERIRIASELHDDIGQRLSLVQLELSRLRKAADRAPRLDLKSSVLKVVDQINEISDAARGLSHGLHPVQLEYLGLVPALRSFCSEIQKSVSIEIELREQETPHDLDRDTSLCLYRVAQEALHNVVKHSQARRVLIELRMENPKLWMRITDDGIGFATDREPATSLGLINMGERLKAMGGALKIVSGPEKGTVLEAWVPVKLKPPA